LADHQVLFAVAIEIARRNVDGIRSNGKALGRLERTVALAQKHIDAVEGVVGHGHVRLAIAIEIGHRHTLQIRAGWRIDGGAEVPLPLPRNTEI